MISVAFGLIAELALALGAAPISRFEGCWELDLDGTWWLAVNGHAEPRKCSRGVELQAFNAYLEYGGLPAGFLTAEAGIMVAGESANEDAFIGALERRLRRVWWCGYNVPDSVPEEHMVERFPDGFDGWISGSGEGYATWAARVEAPSEDAAERIIRSLYGPSGAAIAMRWEPKAREHGWWPEPSRFPRRS